MSDPKLDWFSACLAHLDKVRLLAQDNQIAWTSLATQNANAMRAFQGETPDYMLNVLQANVKGLGIVHEGVLVSKHDALVIRIEPALADKLWHQAAAQSN